MSYALPLCVLLKFFIIILLLLINSIVYAYPILDSSDLKEVAGEDNFYICRYKETLVRQSNLL